MTNATFFRLFSSEDKADALSQALSGLNAGRNLPGVLYAAVPESFKQIPGSPFPYWVSSSVRALFMRCPQLEGNGAEVRLGLKSNNDFRFMRLWWEPQTDNIGADKVWAAHVKGGAFSPYYGDVHLLIRWANDGADMAAFSECLGDTFSRNARSIDHYFRPGFTYSRRSQRGFSVRIMPRGCIFADKGPGIFNPISFEDAYLLGLLNSSTARALLSMQMAFGSYEVGAVQRIPYVAPPADVDRRVGELALRCHNHKRDDDRSDETAHAFSAASLLLAAGDTLAARMEAALLRSSENAAAVATHGYEIDQLVLGLYDISPEDRAAIDDELRPHPGSYPDDTSRLDETRFRQAYLTKEAVADEEDGEGADGGSAESTPARRRTRTRYRDWEELAHLFGVNPAAIGRRRAELGLIRPDELAAEVENLLSYCLGVVFGRWDVRIGKNPALATMLGGAWDALPICAPGTLTEDAARLDNAPLPYRPERLPAEHGDLPAGYPVAVQWSGVVVDDPEHPDDVVRRVQEALAYLWGERAMDIEQEACEILGIKELREYFRKPATFFATHLSRYSKSRRQAPIYWPLSTASGSYTLWLYYPRLTSDTLFTALNRYLEPRIAEVQRTLTELEEKIWQASGREASRLREGIEATRTFLSELADLRTELLRVAALPYRPNLNDGVIINAAPLHRLFRLPRWAKDTTECWSKLERGEYDWAHLAYTIWPDRVREKCRSDKSLAIAHGLEDLYVEPPATTSKARKRK